MWWMSLVWLGGRIFRRGFWHAGFAAKQAEHGKLAGFELEKRPIRSRTMCNCGLISSRPVNVAL